MSIMPCPEASENCIYWNRPTPPELVGQQEHGCKSDIHHIYGRARAREMGHIAYRFALLPENTEQICRAEHDEITYTNTYPDFPPTQIMLNAIEQARYGRA